MNLSLNCTYPLLSYCLLVCTCGNSTGSLLLPPPSFSKPVAPPPPPPTPRLEPNLPLFFADFAFWQCSKILPILPEIMPVSTYFARNYAMQCLPILPEIMPAFTYFENVLKNKSNDHYIQRCFDIVFQR